MAQIPPISPLSSSPQGENPDVEALKDDLETLQNYATQVSKSLQSILDQLERSADKNAQKLLPMIQSYMTNDPSISNGLEIRNLIYTSFPELETEWHIVECLTMPDNVPSYEGPTINSMSTDCIKDELYLESKNIKKYIYIKNELENASNLLLLDGNGWSNYLEAISKIQPIS